MVVRTNDEILYGRVEGLLLSLIRKTRVGRLDLEFGDDHEYTCDDVMMWSLTDLSLEYYEKSHGNGRYTFSIM